MMENVIRYLGQPASVMFASEPFNLWKFERSVEEDLSEIIIDYVSDQHGLSLACNGDETINSIFLYADTAAQSLLGVPVSLSRGDVLKLFGKPSKSGEAIKHPILGDCGSWDRYDREDHSMHFEYNLNERVKMITVMRPEVVP